jgi:L-fuconolactonase
MTIDSHQHFWQYNPVEHHWMTEAMSIVKKDFLPTDLMPILKENNIEGTVLVQVTQTQQETDSFLKIAEEYDFVKGIVGWVDLRSNDIVDKLRNYQKIKKLKGFRHVLQLEEPQFMLQQEFLRGINALKEFGFTYDILVYPIHLSAALILVEKNPEQYFVIDHLAKPFIKDHKIGTWQKKIEALASHKNVFCKISGMVTEAEWKNWKYEDFIPYMDVIVNSFGLNRIMFGSDWPMCLVSASYGEVIQIVRNYFTQFSEPIQQLFFGINAMKFYNL